jgi:hypothetical protein
MPNLPRQDVPEKDKTADWAGQCIDYGKSLLYFNNPDNILATRLWNSYNGVKDPKSIQWIEKTYGSSFRAKMIPYRVGRTKQDVLNGEFLSQPLSATVETINIKAKSEKMLQTDIMMGAMIAKPELMELKEKAGVDVMEGAPIPDDENDPLWAKMSPKDKQEDIMQIIIDEQIKQLRLVSKFAELFTSARVTGRCFAKVEINQKGDVDFIPIDVRNSIYEEIEGDDMLVKSPIKGCRITMPVHELLMRYELTKEQRDIVYNIQSQPNYYINKSNGWIRRNGNGIVIDVVHVEWKSVKPSYYKIMPKTPNQLAFDDTTDTITKEIPWEIYENRKAEYDKGEAKGEFKIVTKFEEDLWEGTEAGGLKELRFNMRRKPAQLRRHDSPSYILDSSYVGCLFGTYSGVRIPLQQVIENFDTMFDIVMYQILKELNMVKGRVLGYDAAGLPIDMTVEKIMYQAANDGFVVYNSMAEGNMAKRNLDLKGMLQSIDLGFSDSFRELVALKSDILNTLDRVTGINELREGAAPASSTVTNAQQGLQNSRTITAPLFYQMQQFIEHTMVRIVEATKISWAFYKLDKGEQILGSEKFKYMQVSRELGYRDYGVHIADGGRYNKIRQRMQSYIELALNAKEIHISDALRFEIAETTVEAKHVFDEALARVQQIAQQQAAQEQQAAMAQQQQMLAAQEQQQQQDVQNVMAIESQKIADKTQSQMAIDDNKAQNKVIEQNHKLNSEANLSQEQ